MDNRNIVLVGFMGTGKTTIGGILANRLGRPLVDIDAYIEEKEHRTISSIFADEGEPYFRKLERTAVQELSEQSGLIITPGGGIVLDPKNIQDLSRQGVVICLRADPAVILKRVESETHRPLLEEEDKAKRILDLLQRRQALYDAIPIQVNTSELSPTEVVEHILSLQTEV